MDNDYQNQKIFGIGGGGPYGQFGLDLCQFSEKERSNWLYIPTPGGDSPYLIEHFKFSMSKKSGVSEVNALPCIHSYDSKDATRLVTEWADVIFVSGGNTLNAMKCWRNLGLDLLLQQARIKGVVLSGFSAGMLCWFESGHSDSMSYYYSAFRHQIQEKVKWNYVNVQCLNFVPHITGCPHFHGENRVNNFVNMMKEDYSISTGLGVDDSVAIQIRGNEYRIRMDGDSMPEDGAWHCRRDDDNMGNVDVIKLDVQEDYRSLDLLRNEKFYYNKNDE